MGTIPRDARPSRGLTTVTLTACTATMSTVRAEDITVGTFDATPFDVTGANSPQAVTAVILQRSSRVGNLVQVAARLQANIAVDFTGYPVVLASVPAELAPQSEVSTGCCIFTPVAASYLMTIFPDGRISGVFTGFPYPADVYTLDVLVTYVI
jgi:hypothetical protein